MMDGNGMFIQDCVFRAGRLGYLYLYVFVSCIYVMT